jgi:hypothetical protein
VTLTTTVSERLERAAFVIHSDQPVHRRDPDLAHLCRFVPGHPVAYCVHDALPKRDRYRCRHARMGSNPIDQRKGGAALSDLERVAVPPGVAR